VTLSKAVITQLTGQGIDWTMYLSFRYVLTATAPATINVQAWGPQPGGGGTIQNPSNETWLRYVKIA
jgi:hypothetical protein